MVDLTLPRPSLTVATVVARDERYLCVEETTSAGVRFNQPAGHVEAGESLVEAAIRETLEETGYVVVPTALVGIYRWHAPGTTTTYLRFCFAAEVTRHDGERPLDEGILRAGWWSYESLLANRREHRSPLVLRCIDDFRAGTRLPLSLLTEVLP